ncbi:MAG: DUF5722 domain-containing protein [Rubripirellula sp.]
MPEHNLIPVSREDGHRIAADRWSVFRRFLPLATVLFAIAFCTNALPQDEASSTPSIGPNGQPFRTHDVELTARGGVIDIRTTGGDPYLIWRWQGSLASEQFVVAFECFCPDEIDQVSAYLGPPISESTRVNLPNIPVAEGWNEYAAELIQDGNARIPEQVRMLRLDLGTRADTRLRIRNLRIRPRSAQEVASAANALQRRQEKEAASRRIGEYFHQSFPLQISDVEVTEDTVSILGPTQGIPPQGLQLIEYPPHLSIDTAGITVDATFNIQNGQYRFDLPRFAGERDRRFCGWRIGEVRDDGVRFLSARHFPSRLLIGKPDHASSRPKPASQKGLSGLSNRGPMDDLPKLGIDAVTLNLVLNRFLTDSDGPRHERIDVMGPPIYFNHAAFDGFDRWVDFAREHQIVVTAIVLIPRSKRSNSQSPLVHPESNGGVYAMPDLATERGAAIYATVLDRIAYRYRHTDRKPGGISNWIAHNEIDFHPVWTNMGPQPRLLCTETYYRSMRMIHDAARSYNAHARVFASLTHHWAVPNDGKWRQLAPKEMLETLQQYSEMEVDFSWGVAYHPYPQSLFAPVAWNDKNITDQLDTPLITIQNLHVLGDFLSQPKMLDADGAMRPVLLSEQGFHTESYEPEAQNRQAGSLLYAMNQIRSFPWVESFHYHRWIDHPDEGGLMLGLRTLPTKDEPHGKPKRSWHVYRSIGTEDEAQETRDLPQP